MHSAADPAHKRATAARKLLRRFVKFHLRHVLEVDDVLAPAARRKLERLLDEAQDELDVGVQR